MQEQRSWSRLAVIVALAVPLVAGIAVGCSEAKDSAAPAAEITTTVAESTSTAASSTTAAASNEDFVAQPTDFVNLKKMTPIRGFFIANSIGRLDEAIAVANNPEGGRYPVGTIVQLVPQEAMVKRRAGFDPASNDWEFFELDTSAAGTAIHKRGGSEVVNRFGGNSCVGCHQGAKPQFDFVCEEDHGCAPLPIGRDFFEKLQQADPRPVA